MKKTTSLEMNGGQPLGGEGAVQEGNRVTYAGKGTPLEVDKDAPAKPKGDREPIPIRRIVLQSGVNADLPGKTGAHALDTGTHSGNTWVITYEPWARRYVVLFQRAQEKPETAWVPEAWVMAYPA